MRLFGKKQVPKRGRRPVQAGPGQARTSQNGPGHPGMRPGARPGTAHLSTSARPGSAPGTQTGAHPGQPGAKPGTAEPEVVYLGDPEKVVDKQLAPKKKKKLARAKHAQHIHHAVAPSKAGRGGEVARHPSPEAPHGVDRQGQPIVPGKVVPGTDLRESNMAWVTIANANWPQVELTGSNMRKINLSKANLQRAVLRQADLFGADLSRCRLKEADLSYANLTGVDLSRADLTKAILRGADLSGANCRMTRFEGADLTDAILAEADFPMAQFRKAHLRNVNLHAANLGGANLFEAVLEDCAFRETYYTDETIKPDRTFQWPQGTIKKKIVRHRDED